MDKFRKEQKMTLYALAKKACISPNALYHWRDCQSSPTLYVLSCLADALGVSPESLIFDISKTNNLTSEQLMILRRWGELKESHKATILNIMDAFEENGKK